LDDTAERIIAHLDQVQNEHDNLMQQLKTSEKLNHDLRSGNLFVMLSNDKFNSFLFS